MKTPSPAEREILSILFLEYGPEAIEVFIAKAEEMSAAFDDPIDTYYWRSAKSVLTNASEEMKRERKLWGANKTAASTLDEGADR